MKKLLSLLLCAAFLLLFTACATEEGAKDAGPDPMQVAPSALEEGEKNLLSLVGAGQSAVLFDYRVDESVKSVRVERYELEGDAWRAFGGGSFAVSGEEGRIALTLDPRADRLRFAVQSGSGTSAIENQYADLAADVSGMAIASSRLSSPADIEIGEEIPLALQVISDSDEIVSYDVSEFFQPESYAQYDYDHVYAVTVTFLGDELG